MPGARVIGLLGKGIACLLASLNESATLESLLPRVLSNRRCSESHH